jgi:hypothetical protein
MPSKMIVPRLRTMHKTPKDIARSLRAFKRAHKLGLLHHVGIVPGAAACEVARSQIGVSYICNAVPRLPLAQCTQKECLCDYAPIGKEPVGRRSKSSRL